MFAIGKLDTFGRPLGGGEVVTIPMAHWELDDPLPRFATGAFNLKQWWEASAELTHRIFVDTKQFDRWLASLKPLGPLTNRQVEAILDPQSERCKRWLVTLPSRHPVKRHSTKLKASCPPIRPAWDRFS